MATTDRRGVIVSATDPSQAADPNPGLAIKTAVRMATTAAITLSGIQTIDGVAGVAADRVLVKDQVDASQNGIYAMSAGAWQRTLDARANSQWANGLQVAVTSGGRSGGYVFMLSTTDPVTIGTTSLNFVATITPQIALEFVIDGGGSTIGAGFKGFLELPFAVTLKRWTILSEVIASAVIDVWKAPYANFPPTVSNSIVAAAPPTLTNARSAQSGTLTGWTAAADAGDIFGFNVNSVAVASRLTISLLGSRP